MEKLFFSNHIAPTIPQSPGIYRYYDNGKKLLYVGKAKDLKKRISSYFTKTFENQKTASLVEQIQYIEWTITDNEHDAFLLENSLIKHFRPKYNIRLKDDKAYPYIVIKREKFPRVMLTRQMLKDGSEYIGPFTSVSAAYYLLQFIKQNFMLRSCSLPLNLTNIQKGKFKVCLEYHIKNCKGPCEGFQSEENYMQSIKEVRQIVKGNIAGVIASLREEMFNYSASLNFEKAQEVKLRLELFHNFQSKSAVTNLHTGNIDVASIIESHEEAYINYIVVKEGQIIHSYNICIEKQLDDEDIEKVLAFVIATLRPKFASEAREIIVPFDILMEDKNVKVTVPISGNKKKLLELSFKNVEHYMLQLKKKKTLLLNKKTEEEHLEILTQLQDDLSLPELPIYIECFDNSNFQGSFPVAAMVCFKGGMPLKKDYRKFHIKTVEGINDFDSMEEIVYRRYYRLIKENKPLPQLIIIDGGKGQLGSAMKSIHRLQLIGKTTLIGLAKREESIFFPGDSEPVRLPYNSDSLLLIRRIRDEVHRFGITFHRNTRSKGTITNQLENIKGIGEKTAQTLLRSFRSVKNIKEASIDELSQIVGKAKAKIIYQYFFNNQ